MERLWHDSGMTHSALGDLSAGDLNISTRASGILGLERRFVRSTYSPPSEVLYAHAGHKCVFYTKENV